MNLNHVRHVLVVDDEKWMRLSVIAMLENEGISTSEADNGRIALNIIAIHMNLPNRIDLIVTDVKMPVLSGVDMLQMLREQGNNIPVLVMSSDFNDDILLEINATNNTEIIEKPFKTIQLIAKIEGLVSGIGY